MKEGTKIPLYYKNYQNKNPFKLIGFKKKTVSINNDLALNFSIRPIEGKI